MSAQPPRLGRGLAALMGETSRGTAVSPSSHISAQSISIDQLQPGPFQPRTNFQADTLAELVDSIRARGVLQPLLVRPHPKQSGQYQIIAGERRWRAAQTAGLHEVPVMIRDLDDVDSMAASLVENLQRQDLNPIEEGEGFRRLLEEFGLTQEQLSTAVGKSRSHVANVMRLLNLPLSVREHVQTGRLSAGHARALLAHPDPEAAAKTVIERGLSVRQTEALANGRERDGKTTPAQTDPETEALARDLSQQLGLTVQISFDGRAGVVSIRYKNLDQLDGVIALLNKAGSQ